MLKKSDKTKQYILSTAKRLFSQKGYAAVTMKDICEACNLSRGGLYRYFGSTKEIFLQYLNDDKDDGINKLDECIRNNVPPDRLLQFFFEDRKNTRMVGDNCGLSYAIHEFSHAEPDQQDYMQKRCRAAADGLIKLLKYGQDQGVFKNFDLYSIAMHILMTLDSLETSASVLEINEDTIEKQFKVLYSLVLDDTRGHSFT